MSHCLNNIYILPNHHFQYEYMKFPGSSYIYIYYFYIYIWKNTLEFPPPLPETMAPYIYSRDSMLTFTCHWECWEGKLTTFPGQEEMGPVALTARTPRLLRWWRWILQQWSRFLGILVEENGDKNCLDVTMFFLRPYKTQQKCFVGTWFVRMGS